MNAFLTESDRRIREDSQKRNNEHAQKMVRKRIKALPADLYVRSKRKIDLLLGCWDLVSRLADWESAILYRTELEKLVGDMEKKATAKRVHLVLHSKTPRGVERRRFVRPGQDRRRATA
jgi:hypothetical protein